MRREIVESIEQEQAELRRIDEEATEISRTFDTYRKIMGITLEGEPKAQRSVRAATHALPRGSYGSLAYQALVELGGDATLGEIVGHLRQNGSIPAEGPSYYSTRSALNRLPGRVIKSGKRYRLAELEPPQEAT
jgi:hypothetical protein